MCDQIERVERALIKVQAEHNSLELIVIAMKKRALIIIDRLLLLLRFATQPKLRERRVTSSNSKKISSISVYTSYLARRGNRGSDTEIIKVLMHFAESRDLSLSDEKNSVTALLMFNKRATETDETDNLSETSKLYLFKRRTDLAVKFEQFAISESSLVLQFDKHDSN
ncbi:uncharacterized protein PHALS_07662 [Plasmopara halstedii]|uniref:Uncharacterized protein n=1 Tax=Plasmopara halstedii TaxID=4781 RepID=A0A0P1B6M7_PLAHL|nr:uncharacterized protein PHALS_07662 [Plasmopara halstedii]CEG49926.1 hypothetical protein PHALS_07662 [Plasmopara halstedii]|eukprot:XP_024586295.1 hypothetical protein PHALS_07662 [Plasmopara halstedii]